MKKFLFILAYLLLLPGCSRGGTPEPTSAPTALPSAAPTAAETTLCGAVYELTDDSMVIQCDSGGLYAFPLTEGAELVPGQRIELRCKGTLDEQSLWQSAAILGFRAEPMAEAETDSIHTLRGTVQDATAYILTVRGEDGHLYSFPRDPARCFAPNGILVGYRAEVDCAEEPNPAETWQMVTVLAMRITATEVPYTEPDHAAAMRRAAKIMKNMSLEERAAQVFLGRLPLQGTAARPLGGYVLYAENAAGKTPSVLKTELEAMQAAADITLVFAVDEEGGTVNRLSAYTAFRSAPFPAPMSLYHNGGWLAVNTDTVEKCSLLRGLGIHVNLAPVADVCSPGTYMYPRSFGGDAALTAQYVDEVVRGYKAAGMGCVLKHFPGYGDNADTHTGIARDNRSLEELALRDLQPFAAGIAAGADCVLLSHNVVAALDPALPASLSPAVYAYLRDNMDFHGVAMTDDLGMAGVQAFGDSGAAAVQALCAGCDLVCSSSFEREIAAVVAAVQQGTLSEERLNEAVQRVLCWKVKLGLID